MWVPGCDFRRVFREWGCDLYHLGWHWTNDRRSHLPIAAMPVFHTRNGSITPDGRESTDRLRRGGGGGHPEDAAVPRYRGTAAYDLTPELAAAPGELVVDKLTSSAFHQV